MQKHGRIEGSDMNTIVHNIHQLISCWENISPITKCNTIKHHTNPHTNMYCRSEIKIHQTESYHSTRKIANMLPLTGPMTHTASP